MNLANLIQCFEGCFCLYHQTSDTTTRCIYTHWLIAREDFIEKKYVLWHFYMRIVLQYVARWVFLLQLNN
jgi:hypothetical protein